MRSLRRLMANDIAYGLVLLVFVAAVVAWVYWPHGHAQTVVRTQTTVLVEPPSTPLLRDSGPKNNPRDTRRDKNGRTITGRPIATGILPARGGTRGGTQNRSLPVKKRPGPKTTPSPRPSSAGGSTTSQPSSPPPAPQKHCPPVAVTVPAPVTVQAGPAAVNC